MGLGTLGFLSTVQPSLNSTVQGLGTAGFLSSITSIQPTLNSTLKGLGSMGYISSLLFVTLVSTQQLYASSIGIGCNSPMFQLDVLGTVHGSLFSTPSILTSSFFGNLGDATTLILYEI
jgi:hypothetical protein